MSSTRPARGRPRSERAQSAILSSAFHLLEEGGLGSVTVEAVAQRAGVGKPTIYRYWNNAQELAMAAVMARPSPAAAAPVNRSALERHVDQLTDVVQRFASPSGRQTARLMAAADADSELSKAFRNQIILKSREQGRELLVEAIERGELKPGLPLDAVLDMIYGPLFYRLLVGHAPIDEKLAKEIMGVIRSAYGTRRRARCR